MIPLILKLLNKVIPKREHFYYYTESPTYVQEGFTAGSALFMAFLADMAYYTNIDVNVISKFMQEHRLNYNPANNNFSNVDTGTSLIWATSVGNKDLYISFRGTQLTVDNLKSDLYESLVAFPNVNMNLKVSYGFLKAWLSVRDYVSTLVNRIQPIRLYITGHSLGGALATLCAFDLKYYAPDIDPIVYTFASPRVGDIGFAQHYDEFINKSYRVQNKWDPIPRLPTTYQGYKHVKDEVLIDEKPECSINAPTTDNIPWNPENHKLSHYVQNIKKILRDGVPCVTYSKFHATPFNKCINSVGPPYGYKKCIY